MVDSEWIIFLPLVGAIVGGFVGAVATGLVRSIQDRNARNQERKGLLLLIDIEIFDNNKHLNGCIEEGGWFDVLSINRLRTGIWDDSKTRLTQLLSPIAVHALAVYYMKIAEIPESVESVATPRNESTVAVLAEGAEGAIELGDAARRLIHREYIKEPDYALPIPEQPSISDKD
jgi:hypothetical protein